MRRGLVRHVPGARLSAFLDDELPELQTMAATRHLAGCDRCLAELRALRTTRDALRRLPALHAPVFIAGARPARARARRPRPIGARQVARAPGLVATVVPVLLAVVLAFAVLVDRGPLPPADLVGVDQAPERVDP